MWDDNKFGGFSDLVTTLKQLVQGVNQLNQTVAAVFPSWTTGQIPGTTTNGNATAGNIGEYISSTILSGAPVALTTATPANVTSISLTGGDWDVWGTVGYIANAATTATIFKGGINNVSATLPIAPGSGAEFELGLAVGAGATMPVIAVGSMRVTLSVTTTIYLVAQSTFAVNTMSAYGFIGARRRR